MLPHFIQKSQSHNSSSTVNYFKAHIRLRRLRAPLTNMKIPFSIFWTIVAITIHSIGIFRNDLGTVLSFKQTDCTNHRIRKPHTGFESISSLSRTRWETAGLQVTRTPHNPRIGKLSQQHFPSACREIISPINMTQLRISIYTNT